jgi:hypothetical protein
MYFDDCKNPEELGRLIKDILDSCFDNNMLVPKWREKILPLIAPSVRKYQHPDSLSMHLEGLCNRARQRILDFRLEDLKLPRLPAPAPNELPHKVLQTVLDWCIEACKQTEPDENAEEGLTKAIRLAYQSYQYAVDKKPELAEATDKDVFDWLKENGTGEAYYKLPSCDTWKRQVRQGRKVHGTQENIKRAGRNGRSTINSNQIKSLSEISSRYDDEAD